MPGLASIGRPRLSWLIWLTSVLVVVLFVGTKVTERLVLGRHWHFFGRLDLAELGVLAVAVGACMWYAHQRMQWDLERVEEQRRQAEALAAENVAVVQAVSAVVRELAQPLSGALSYGELLSLHAADLDAHGQQELAGLREGVARLAALLQTVRQTVDHAPLSPAPAHLAAVVEDAVTPARLQVSQ